MNLARWIPAKYLDLVLLVYVLIFGAIPWTILWFLNIQFLSLVPINPLIWAAPAMFAYRQYEKDRYASVPVTLLGRLLWSHYTAHKGLGRWKTVSWQFAHLQIKFIYPPKDRTTNLDKEYGENL